MNWTDFQKTYRAQIRNMAWRLYQRWSLPYGVSVEDVEQELWMGAWSAWEAYDGERGNMLREAYAVCTAKQTAKRWIHGQRNALRRDSRAPSRFAACDENIEAIYSAPSAQEAECDFVRSLMAALKRCRGEQRAALLALVEHAFNVDEAAIAIEVNHGNRKQARRAVRGAARQFRAQVEARA